MTEYKIIEVTEKPYVYAESRCAMQPEAISKAMGKAFEDVMEFIQSHAMALTGPALSVYYTFDPDTVEFRAGFFVSAEDANKAQGEIKAATTPAGRVINFIHTGPYTELGDSYQTMMGWMQDQGLALGAPTWEVYIDDPDSVPQDRLRTDIFVALAEPDERHQSPEATPIPKVLVVYYSRTGHTEQVAKALAEKLGADLEPIREARSRKGFWQYLSSAREALTGKPASIEPVRHDPAAYDMVILGSPVWASHPSTPVSAYLAANRDKLKALACFVTLGGSGAEKTLARMEQAAGKQALAKFSTTERELKSGNWNGRLEQFTKEIGKALKA